MTDKNNKTLGECQYKGKYACPIDRTILINHEDAWNTYYGTCPTCGQDYSRYEVDNLEEVGQKRVQEARAQIERINELKPQLEKLVELFEKHHPAPTQKLKYYETLMRVLTQGEYSMRDKTKLYLDVKKFCEDNPEITPDFEFRHRGGRWSSHNVDVTLRNLMDSERIVSDEHSGQIIIRKN